MGAMHGSDREVVNKIIATVQAALETWQKTLRLCLVLAAIALILAAWNS